MVFGASGISGRAAAWRRVCCAGSLTALFIGPALSLFSNINVSDITVDHCI